MIWTFPIIGAILAGISVGLMVFIFIPRTREKREKEKYKLFTILGAVCILAIFVTLGVAASFLPDGNEASQDTESLLEHDGDDIGKDIEIPICERFETVKVPVGAVFTQCSYRDGELMTFPGRGWSRVRLYLLTRDNTPQFYVDLIEGKKLPKRDVNAIRGHDRFMFSDGPQFIEVGGRGIQVVTTQASSDSSNAVEK